MAICRFYERGTCKFGDQCKNEHPGADRPPAFRRPTNAYEVLNRDSPGHGSGSRNTPANHSFGQSIPANDFKLDENAIRKDLTEERPIWLLSCYGPGKDAPLQLFGGQPREVSLEEMRLRYYELASQGRIPEAKGEEDSMRVNAEQQLQNAVNDIPGAIRYIREGVNKHPNRHDVVSGAAANESQEGFGGAEAKQTGSFGRMSPAPNAGNPFQGSSQPAFGGPSAFGASKPSPFGKPSAPISAANPFSRAQQPAFGANPFAKPAEQQQQAANSSPKPGPFSPGGPRNTFDRNAPGNAPFFQGHQPAPAANPFAKTAGQQSGGAPGTTISNPFAKTAGQSGAANPFAQPGSTAGATSAMNGFGAASSETGFGGSGAAPAGTSFGGGASSASTNFGKGGTSSATTGFGGRGAAPTTNRFGISAAAPPTTERIGGLTEAAVSRPGTLPPNSAAPPVQSKPNQFGGMDFGAIALGPTPLDVHGHLNTDPKSTGSGNAPAPRILSVLDQAIPNNGGVRQHAHNGNLIRFKGQPVSYDQDGHPYYKENGKDQRIWLPKDRDQAWHAMSSTAVDAPMKLYTPEIKQELKHMWHTGAFPNGRMPLLPLPKSDTTFDI